MVVEPPKQNLIWRQPQELLQRLPIIQQAIQLRVDLDVDLTQQTPADDLPDQAENEVLFPLLQIVRSDIDDRASDTLCRGDDDVVVFGHLECVECTRLASLGRCFVEDSLVDRIGYRVVDQLTQDKTVCNGQLMKCDEGACVSLPLHSSNSCMVSDGMGRMWPMSLSPARTCTSASCLSRKSDTHPVDVVGERRPLILVDGVTRVGSCCALN